MTSLPSAEQTGKTNGFREGARVVSVRGIRSEQPFAVTDWVAEEVPVALEYNGISHAVMLATPLDLEDFALGFSLSEGILRDGGELYSVDEVEGTRGITLHLTVSSEAFVRLKERRRSMTGRTGCGLCGTESLEQVCRPLKTISVTAPALGRLAISRAMAQLRDLQMLQRITGAVHAAAWCTAKGEVRWMREDVGRHNALDKLIGALDSNGVDSASGFVAVTSRASFEMVQKTAAAGVPLLAAISAPTSFAIEIAERAGITLIGFARQRDLVVYSRPERLNWGNSDDNVHAY